MSDEKKVKTENRRMVSVRYVHLCKRLCEFIPQQKREKMFFQMLEYAGIEGDFDFWIGRKILLSMIFGFVAFLLVWFVTGFFGLLGFYTDFIQFGAGEFIVAIPVFPLIVSVLIGIAVQIAVLLMFYLQLYYTIEGRSELVESILPDFLLLVASNINAGMTPFSAFRASARKEFGPLTKEIKIATSKSLGTESFQHALRELSVRIRSQVLGETVSFFGQAIRSGGHVSKLLESSANDLRQTQEMKKELVSSTRMYVIFVAFVVIVGAPLLLAVAVTFLKMISKIQGESIASTATELGSVGFLATEMNISPAFMQNMSFVLLLGNAILSSLFVGVLSSGKSKMGLRFAPMILVASVVIFLICGMFLATLLGVV